MPISLLKNIHRHYRLYWFIQDYWEACAILHRKRDLEQLLAWATRKRHFGPRNHYWNLLIDEEQRLWRCQRRSRRAAQIAHIAVWVNSILNPTPWTAYRKGHARRYVSARNPAY